MKRNIPENLSNAILPLIGGREACLPRSRLPVQTGRRQGVGVKPKSNFERKRPVGFTYCVSEEQLEAYRKWPIERRLQWLLIGNQLRKSLPKKTIEIQEALRRGKI